MVTFVYTNIRMRSILLLFSSLFCVLMLSNVFAQPDKMITNRDNYFWQFGVAWTTTDDDGDDRTRDRVFIEAIRAIKPGEELAYDYGITLAEAHTPRLKKIWECRCGSKNCTGTMLKPKRPAKAAKPAKASTPASKKAGKKAGKKAAGAKKPARA